MKIFEMHYKEERLSENGKLAVTAPKLMALPASRLFIIFIDAVIIHSYS